MGLFVTFEGPDGGGKSTQAQLLADSLRRAGHRVTLTREPGGTAIGEHIREILQDRALDAIDPVAEAMLFNAARAQLLAERIRPDLQLGNIVICDRFSDSTLAYQGYGSGLSVSKLRSLEEIAVNGLRPELTVLLDLPVVAGIGRKLATARCDRGLAECSRIEAKDTEFHERVRAGFLTLSREDPDKWLVLDATRPIDSLHRIILKVVLALLQRN
jgi:dTMP kinase